jgi:hypothetical protein
MHCGVRLHGEKNPIMISPYSIFGVNKLVHDEIFKILNINHLKQWEKMMWKHIFIEFWGKL